MPLPYNVARILPYFYRKIEAYDLIGGVDGYKSIMSRTPIYTFIGVMIPPTDKDLNLFDEGELAQGSMVLYVKNTVKLYMGDAVDEASRTTRQTIILFDGDEYRVKGYSNRALDGLHRKYTMVRYFGGRSATGL
jgi:hypothetical protein